MRRIGIYMSVVLIITIIIPTVIVKTIKFVPIPNSVEGKSFENKRLPVTRKTEQKIVQEEDIQYIKVFNIKSKEVENLPLEEYIKGVVAAEMPARFHIEALKAQAIAARTYAISRSIRFSDGHPDHKDAPLCSGVHCQAYLSLEQLEEIHGKDWIDNYWGKIEEAVDTTKSMIIYYNGEIIEPLYHSSSGGMTEDAINVFAMDSPYLKAVKSPYEEDAPKYRDIMTLTVEEFIDKLNTKFPKAKMTKSDFLQKIKLVERTDSGRIKKIAIGGEIIDGRVMRELFGLNSTNFNIIYDKNIDLIEIETYGNGHGVGMSQWGANGMAKNGKSFEEILKHYYSGIDIGKM